MNKRILTGDVSAVLRKLPDASFDGCFCDPPYGIAFMGKQWDRGVPSADVWAEVLRVLKPGAPLMAFGGTRTFHRLACAIEDAGFILTDTLRWLHGQGFPKGHAQLKPAWEPITLAWKKGKRALNIDGGRIGGTPWKAHDATGLAKTKFFTDGETPVIHKEPHSLGRWPANLILDEVSAGMVDAASGICAAGARPAKRNVSHFGLGHGTEDGERITFDSGGASRFFYCAKASRKERGEGNTHPTVKPLKLCEHLAKLILPPDPEPHLLIPFSGSGSEMLGAKRAGWKRITGIEINPEYAAIAAARLKAA